MTLEQLVVYTGTILCAWLLVLLAAMVARRRRIGLDLGGRTDAWHDEGPRRQAPARSGRAHPGRWRHALGQR
jgi:hypothetical protein